MPENRSDNAYRIVETAVNACSMPSLTLDGLSPADQEQLLSRPLEELGMDSLACMEFCISIQCDTGIDMTIGQLKRLKTLQGVVDYLAQRA